MRPLGTAPPVPRHVAADWERLRRRPDSVRRAASWALTDRPVRDLEELVVETLPDAAGAERRLHRLVDVARDDELAARVVLQRIVPDLVRVHRRRRWRSSVDVGLDDLLATGWTVIRTYNPGRRPARLANALVSDIEYREYRAPLRRIGHGNPADPCTFDEIAADPRSADALVELAALVRDAIAAGFPEDDLALLRQLASGRSTTDIAGDLDVTPRTIRNRRERIALRLREVATAA